MDVSSENILKYSVLGLIAIGLGAVYFRAREKQCFGLKVTHTGYRADSPDVNNPVNVIPSSNISMKGVDFPIYGVDNLGFGQVMQPGQDYKFPGEYVIEFPMRRNVHQQNITG